MGNRVTQSHLSNAVLERGVVRSVQDKAYTVIWVGFLYGARPADAKCRNPIPRLVK